MRDFFLKLEIIYPCLFYKPHRDSSMYYNYQDKLSFLDFFFLFAAYDSFYSIFDLEMLGIDGRNLSKIM